jgi:hypothetical protein
VTCDISTRTGFFEANRLFHKPRLYRYYSLRIESALERQCRYGISGVEMRYSHLGGAFLASLEIVKDFLLVREVMDR